MATLLLATTTFYQKASILAKMVMMIGASYIDQRLFGQTAPSGGAKMSDLSLQTSTYGIPMNTVYGTARVAGNIIWGTNYVEHKHKSGGKGGGSATTYSYTITCAIGICKGPILGITRVWADGTEITAKFKTQLPTEEELLSAGYSKGNYGGSMEGNKVQYRFYPGDEQQLPDSWVEGIEGEGTAPAFRGLAYIVLKDLEVGDYGNRIPSFTFEVVTGIRTLAAAVQDVTQSAGVYEIFGEQAVDLDDLVLSGNHLHGVAITGDKSYRDRIDMLRNAYLFDGTEREGRIVFERRSSRNILPVGYEDLGAKEGNEGDPERFKLERAHEMELPKKLKLTYSSLDKNYEQGTMLATRIVARGSEETSVSVEPILTDAEAKALAEQKLYELWAARNSVSFDLGMWWAFLDPGTLLQVDMGTRLLLLAPRKISFGVPGLVKVEGLEVSDTAYAIAGRTADQEVQPSLPAAISGVELHILDLPRLPNDSTGTYGEYIVSGSETFYGANLFRTLDGGESYNLLLTLDTAGTIGTASTVLGSGPEEFWDRANTLTVVLLSGELESRSEANVLNGYNAAIVGNEIIQYQTAALVGTKTYRLSNLLRGRLGTEDAIHTHVAGERFVALNAEEIKKLSETASDWGMERNYRYGSVLTSVSSDTYTNAAHTSTGRIAKCWAPCHLTGARDSAGNLTLDWIRRAREGGEWSDNMDVPLVETFEKYEIDIYNGSSVVRTLTSGVPTAVYTAEQQILDFGSVQQSVKARIYQVNDLRGRGIPREETI